MICAVISKNYYKNYKKLSPIGTVAVHHDCRRRFVDIQEQPKVPPGKKLMRSSVESCSSTYYDWTSRLFLCSKGAERKYSTVIQVGTIPLYKSLLDICKSRDDDWGGEVKGRLSTCNDLVAEEAIYHISCMRNFRLNVEKRLTVICIP